MTPSPEGPEADEPRPEAWSQMACSWAQKRGGGEWDILRGFVPQSSNRSGAMLDNRNPHDARIVGLQGLGDRV